MGLEDTNVIRTWLETNFKQALMEGDQAVATFRAQVAAMGPDVEQVFGQIEGTTAVVSASVGESLAAMGVQAEKTAGVGEGEAGVGGFAKLTANIMKAERTGLALATGQGLMRAGPMLETLALAAGGPAGVGMAIGGVAMALEVLLPKLEHFIGKMDESAEATKKATEALKAHEKAANEAHAAVVKLGLAPGPGEGTGGAEITSLLAGGGAEQMQAGIAANLAQSGFGALSTEQVEQITEEHRKSPEYLSFSALQGKLDAQRQKNIQDEAARMVVALPTDEGIQRSVEGMAATAPGAFPEMTQETLFATRPENVIQATIGRQRTKEMADAQKAREKIANDLERKTLQEQAKTDADNARDRARRDSEWNRDVAAQTRDEDKEIRDEATAQKHAAAEAARAAAARARASTPEAMNRADAAAQQNEAMEELRRQNAARAQFGGREHPAFSASELQQAVGQSLQGRSAGMTLAQAVDYAMGQLEAKIVNDVSRGLARQNQTWQNLGAR